jgi:acyl dehydratase
MHKIRGKYFEEWAVGDEFETTARTVTETDIVLFAGISGDYNPLHTDEEFAKKSFFGTRVAHGFLIHSISIGLINQTGYFDGTVMAQLGHNKVSFLKGTMAGDTIRVKCNITKLEETSKKDRGVMTFEAFVINQKDEVVAQSERMLMIKKRSS